MARYAEALWRRLMMKRIATTLISLFMFASSVTYGQVASQSAVSQTPPIQNSQTIKITRSDSQHPNKGPAEYFTGSVQVQPLFPAFDPSRTSGGKVTFEPGARTAWHTHPLGQTLIVTVLRSRRQERLAREAAEEAAAKAAAITVDPQPLELESASEEKQEG